MPTPVPSGRPTYSTGTSPPRTHEAVDSQPPERAGGSSLQTVLRVSRSRRGYRQRCRQPKGLQHRGHRSLRRRLFEGASLSSHFRLLILPTQLGRVVRPVAMLTCSPPRDGLPSVGMGDGQPILLQYPSWCTTCGVSMAGGTHGWWDAGTQQVYCPTCGVIRRGIELQRTVTTSLLPPPPNRAPSQGFTVGTAGGSALREHRRRRQNEREAKLRNLPMSITLFILAVLGTYIGVQIAGAVINHLLTAHHLAGRPAPTAPFNAPLLHLLGFLFAGIVAIRCAITFWGHRRTTEVWAIGGAGEETVGARLDQLTAKGLVIIHDRRIPESSANIDHIVVAPTGVHVIDTKKWSGRVEPRRLGSVFNRGPVELFVGGRNRTGYAVAMDSQVAAVGQVLYRCGQPGIPVRASLAITGAQWGWPAKPFAVGDVWVGWPKELDRRLTRPGPFTPEQIHWLGWTLVESLQEA